jgi:hypothetical protein
MSSLNKILSIGEDTYPFTYNSMQQHINTRRYTSHKRKSCK